jgi:hypothetical protein
MPPRITGIVRIEWLGIEASPHGCTYPIGRVAIAIVRLGLVSTHVCPIDACSGCHWGLVRWGRAVVAPFDTPIGTHGPRSEQGRSIRSL